SRASISSDPPVKRLQSRSRVTTVRSFTTLPVLRVVPGFTCCPFSSPTIFGFQYSAKSDSFSARFTLSMSVMQRRYHRLHDGGRRWRYRRRLRAAEEIEAEVAPETHAIAARSGQALLRVRGTGGAGRELRGARLRRRVAIGRAVALADGARCAGRG